MSEGLRERKKEAARLALHEAAFRLMSEQGPENVTVEAIAEAAGMSRRTFSNYFAGKEDALFYRENQRTRHLLALVRDRPGDESATRALRRALVGFTATAELDAERIMQRRLLRSRPSLTTYRTAAHIATERALAQELSARLPEGPLRDLAAQTLAATGLAALRLATTHWLEHPDRPLDELVEAALDAVAG